MHQIKEAVLHGCLLHFYFSLFMEIKAVSTEFPVASHPGSDVPLNLLNFSVAGCVFRLWEPF